MINLPIAIASHRAASGNGHTKEIATGELFGILGPNGAGKTTLFRILTTLLIPTAGHVRIAQHDVVRDAREVRRMIGFTFGGDTGLYLRISACANLVYFAHLYHVPSRSIRGRVEKVLELVGLRDHADDRVATFSRGMKQRLHIARALLHEPAILLFDEPTIGLDPSAARSIRQTIRTLAQAGVTVVLSTHYMLEAHELCQRVAIIDQGTLVALDHPERLRMNDAGARVVDVRVGAVAKQVIPHIRAWPAIETVTSSEFAPYTVLSIQTTDVSATIDRLRVLWNGEAHISVREPTLEDAYMRLMSANHPGQR